MVFETVHQRKDESCYDVSVHLQLIPADGQPFFFAAIRDVTDERRLIRENQRQNEELKAALVAKDFLLREIHHRVKNSLAVVSALLGLQGRQAKSADASSALLQAQERVQVIASIHERLYQDDVQDRIDLSELLEDLGDKTIALMSDGERITFEADVERGMVTSLDRSVPIALVVIEVMINSIKHAFPDGASGVISLGVRLEGDGATIEVSDNGVGMEASDPSAQGSGLGSRIINGLSAQAGAEVSMKSSDKGTHYTLTLPLLH
jgi:two-component sensor histidine kinase